jgi:hypothetical protein
MKYVLTLGWLVSCAVVGEVVFAEDTVRSEPIGFNSYELSQFIVSAGQSPQQVTKLDNNGELLLACIEGKTRDQLRAAGARFAESQVELLKTWRLLEEQDSVLRTAFPILGDESPRVFRRPLFLRGWGHGKTKQVFTRGSGAVRPDGA